MVWACDEKGGALCRKENDGNGSAEEKEERNTVPKRRWLDEVEGQTIISSYIDRPHIKVGRLQGKRRRRRIV